MSANKLPALPPRPYFPQIPHDKKWWLREDIVLEHMDAQDARIAELSRLRGLDIDAEVAVIRRAQKAETKVAELEREIREARELFGLLEWSAALRVYYGNMRRFGIKMQGWLERNAERSTDDKTSTD